MLIFNYYLKNFKVFIKPVLINGKPNFPSVKITRIQNDSIKPQKIHIKSDPVLITKVFILKSRKQHAS